MDGDVRSLYVHKTHKLRSFRCSMDTTKGVYMIRKKGDCRKYSNHTPVMNQKKGLTKRNWYERYYPFACVWRRLEEILRGENLKRKMLSVINNSSPKKRKLNPKVKDWGGFKAKLLRFAPSFTLFGTRLSLLNNSYSVGRGWKESLCFFV